MYGEIVHCDRELLMVLIVIPSLRLMTEMLIQAYKAQGGSIINVRWVRMYLSSTAECFIALVFPTTLIFFSSQLPVLTIVTLNFADSCTMRCSGI